MVLVIVARSLLLLQCFTSIAHANVSANLRMHQEWNKNDECTVFIATGGVLLYTHKQNKIIKV